MTFKFPLHGPDYVSTELASVLSNKRCMEFKDIFDIVHANLRSKDVARGGEEMLRLRAHEKLQAFVEAGIATKNGRKYKGVPKMLQEFAKLVAEHNAKVAALKIACKGTTTQLPVTKAKAEKRKAVQAR